MKVKVFIGTNSSTDSTLNKFLDCYHKGIKVKEHIRIDNITYKIVNIIYFIPPATEKYDAHHEFTKTIYLKELN